MFGGSLPGGPHADVLNATPTTPESIAALIEELKSRARSSFSSGNYPEAERLYSKGLEVSTTPDAVLYANRALARLNLGRAQDSIADANAAIAADPNYVKGHWRLASALVVVGDHSGAVAAFQKGLELEPGNAALKKELEKAKAKAEQAALSAGSDDLPPPIKGSGKTPSSTSTYKTVSSTSSSSSSSAKASATTTNSSSFSSSSSSSSAATSSSKAPSSSSSAAADDDDEGIFTASDKVRGYKVTADGKKTSFFNNDKLTDETKALIGDIAPKRIESALDAATPASLAAKDGISSWNSAGTWEEKDVSTWAKESLAAALKGTTFALPAFAGPNNAGRVVTVNGDVKNIVGSASVATVRGKRRYIYDFNFSVSWLLELDIGRCTGEIKFPDVAPDANGEFESSMTVDALSPPAAKGIINDFVKSDSNGFNKALQTSINKWIKDFEAKYSS